VNFFIGYCCAIAALLAYIAFGLRRLKRDIHGRRPSIDMRDLTDDPADATVDETLTRIEPYVDPGKFTNDELQRLHRVMAQDYLDAAEIRRQNGGRS
jgi:hypothetical protein